MKIRKNLPLIVIIILAWIPIKIWFSMEPVSIRFFDLNSTMTSLGQITGLLGMILFSINLILSNRSHFFDKFFSGLHIFYDHHKWLGAVSFSLLLFHPLFLVVKYITISINSAALFLLPGTNFAITMGIIALGLMIILLVATLYMKIKYHIWRFSHKFMVVVFIFAILHTLFISSDVSNNMFLRYYIFVFAILGLISGAYRSFFRVFFNKDHEFKVVGINTPSDNVTEIEIEPRNSKMEFFPGQFIFIRFVEVGVSSEPHPFSITSTKGDKNLKIVIKSLGDYTSKIGNLRPGAIAKVEGPFGSFFKNRDISKKEIWIGGGVGITPFLSLARSLKNVRNDIYLFYCLNDTTEAVFLKELTSISVTNSRFHLITWYAKEKGWINADKIKELTNGVSDAYIYICGPLSFMRALKEQFIEKGVDKNNINFEEFNFL
ncbi:MAG: ferric reductase-like transmembrane domain-containing protein [bacterium]